MSWVRDRIENLKKKYFLTGDVGVSMETLVSLVFFSGSDIIGYERIREM